MGIVQKAIEYANFGIKLADRVPNSEVELKAKT